jgi:tetratricopeptide (TPR) repeat protein
MSALPEEPSEQQQRHDVIARSIHEIDHAVSEAKARMAVAASERLGLGERARFAFETSLSTIERGAHESRGGPVPAEVDERAPQSQPAMEAVRQEAEEDDDDPPATNVASSPAAFAGTSLGRRALGWVRIAAIVVAVAPLIIAGSGFVVARIDTVSQLLWGARATDRLAEGRADAEVVVAAADPGNSAAGTDKTAAPAAPTAGRESGVTAADLQSFAAAFTPSENTVAEAASDDGARSPVGPAPGPSPMAPSLAAALTAAGLPHLIPAAVQPSATAAGTQQTPATSPPAAAPAANPEVGLAAPLAQSLGTPAAAPQAAATAGQPAQRAEEIARAEPSDGTMVQAASPLRSASPPAKAHIDRGQVLAGKGDVDGALAEFGQAIRVDPKNAQAFGLRALAYASRNERDKAINDWTSAITLAAVDPGRLTSLDLFVAYRNRAVLYEGKQLFAREIADLTHMLDSYWKDPELADALERAWGGAGAKTFLGSIYKLRAGAYARTALPEKAIEDLSVAVTLDRDHAAAAYADRARIELKLGRRERAATDLRTALRLDPGLAEAKEALARIDAETVRRPPDQP